MGYNVTFSDNTFINFRFSFRWSCTCLRSAVCNSDAIHCPEVIQGRKFNDVSGASYDLHRGSI